MRTRPRLRTAFTLVEILVACLLLGVGVLGLASTAVAVARLTGDSARSGEAVERGQARIETLRSSQCSAVDGTLAMRGISEWWSEVPASGGVSLADSVRYAEGVHHALHTELLSSEAWCP